MGAKEVAPSGPLNAPIVVVGRDPGWQEVAKGVPFVGESGKLLNTALTDVGLSRDEILVTNVVGSRPAGDAWGAHEESTIAAGTLDLLRLLAAHPRRVVVALGSQALWACATGTPPPRSESMLERALLGRFGGKITELRGYGWRGATGDAPVLASVHPAFVLRSWLPWRACLTWDLAKAKRLASQDTEVDNGEVKESLFARTREEAERYAEALCRADTLACDTETAGQDTPVCCAFSGGSSRGVSFVLPRDGEVVAELLACPSQKVWQNAQFDLTILKRAGFVVNGEQHDVMLLWHTLEPLIAGRSSDLGSRQSAKSLRFLASVWTNEPWWKDYDFKSEEERWALCATDARVTFEIWQKLRKRSSSTDIGLTSKLMQEQFVSL